MRRFLHCVPCAIPNGQSTVETMDTPHQRANPAEPCYRVPLGRFLKERPSLVLHAAHSISSKHFLETSPLRNDAGFWHDLARRGQTRRHHGFVLQTVTSFHRPRLTHYYGIIRHLTPRGPVLELPLEPALPITTSDRTMPGFPSYCADSLLLTTSSSTACHCSRIGHRVISHARPGRTPNQVRLRYAPTTFYGFLQTPPLASDALAIRILFPTNRVRSVTSTGFASLAGQTKKACVNLTQAISSNAQERTRTSTGNNIPLGPEPSASANSATWARCCESRQNIG